MVTGRVKWTCTGKATSYTLTLHAYTAQREVMVAVLPHDSTKRFATSPKTQIATSTLFALQLFLPLHEAINEYI